MQKGYQRESSTYQTVLSDTLRNDESLVLELARVPETDGKLYCIAQANTSRQKVEYSANLSEALLPETMSEQEGPRCAIPLAVFLCRRTGQHSSLIDASLLVSYRSEKRFGLPTTYGEVYSALRRFYKDTLNVEKDGFLPGSTVADLVAHLADLYTPGLSQPLDGTIFFLQIGSRRLAGDEKIKDIEEMREDALWLMCKSADLSDEDVMIQGLAEKPMLRVILSLQEMQTLAGLQQPFKVLDAREEQSLQHDQMALFFLKR